MLFLMGETARLYTRKQSWHELCSFSVSFDSLLPQLEPPLPLVLLHTHHVAEKGSNHSVKMSDYFLQHKCYC